MLRFIFPSIAWTAFVIIVSLMPGSELNVNYLPFENVDKIAHFIMYSLMTLFWYTGLKRQNIHLKISSNALAISTLGSFILGFVIELIQEYFTQTRFFEDLDLLANGIGCIFGLILFKLIYRETKISTA